MSTSTTVSSPHRRLRDIFQIWIFSRWISTLSRFFLCRYPTISSTSTIFSFFPCHPPPQKILYIPLHVSTPRSNRIDIHSSFSVSLFGRVGWNFTTRESASPSCSPFLLCISPLLPLSLSLSLSLSPPFFPARSRCCLQIELRDLRRR